MALPDFEFSKDNKLQYLDILVYTALKWHNNTEREECFPSQETVAKLSGLSIRFVVNSIKRLEDAKLITVERSTAKRKSNYYYFVPPVTKHLEKIPKSFFEDTQDLSTCERAMLLCIRRFFHHGYANFSGSKPAEFFSNCLGLSKDTVDKQFRGLINKGYVAKRYKGRAAKLDIWHSLTDKIDWNFECYSSKVETVSTSDLIIS